MGNLAGWPYWKVISLTGQSGAGTDYQVKFEIGDSAGGNVHLEGNCTNFPQDIRITDDDGTTLLDHFVEDLTADPIVVHIEVKDDLGSNQDIRVYYGKSGESTASNGANTFIQYHGAASSEFLDSLDIAHPYNIVFEAIAVRNSASNILWGLSNQQDVLSDDRSTISSNNSNWYVSATNDANHTSNSGTPPFTASIEYRLKFTLTGTTLTGYIDGVQKGSPITTNIPNENMGLVMDFYAGTGSQKWSFARKYNSPEPAFSSAGAEQTPPVTGHPWYYRRNQ